MPRYFKPTMIDHDVHGPQGSVWLRVATLHQQVPSWAIPYIEGKEGVIETDSSGVAL